MRRNAIFIPDWIPKFSDHDLERSFRMYHDLQMRFQILTALLLYAFSQVILLPLEYRRMESVRKAYFFLVIFRGITILICLVGWLVIWKRWIRDLRISLLITYNLIGLTFCVMSSMISQQFYLEDQLQDCPFLFFWGSWSLGNLLFFSFMCFNCSGLLFADATAISGIYTILISILPFLLFSTSVPPLPYTIFLLPTFLLFEMLYVHSVEMETRTRYLNQLEAGRDLCRQDKLISSILPHDVSLALKGGNTKIEKLATYYPDVTILFCYIVDFTEHSFVTHPHDTVELCRNIVSVFDRIVEQTGGYKVENIADTYMVCAGCPVKSLNHPLVIARTALAMMKAAETRCWRWPDSSPVQLKIGIHTGPVTAGVIGTKSYSYHLFGDTVNTASRMCSHSIPGKILLSTKSYQKLTASYEGTVIDLLHFKPLWRSLKLPVDFFYTSERGEVQVKGKGLMKLYWLDGYVSQYGDLFAVSMNHQSDKRAYTDRYAQLRASELMKIAVNRCTLRFSEVEIQRPDLMKSNESVSRLLADRRGSQVGQEAAAAMSVGLHRMLNQGIESPSPRIPYQHEMELSSGRVPLTPDSNRTSGRNDKSKKFVTTVRNFGSLDDDTTNIREPDSLREPKDHRRRDTDSGRIAEFNQQRESLDELDDLEAHNIPLPLLVPPITKATTPTPTPAPAPTPTPALTQETTNSVFTKDTLLKMEQSFQFYFDSKSVSIQIHTLSICVMYTFLNVLYHLSEYDKWPYTLSRLSIFFVTLCIARYWTKFRDYSQEILLTTETLTLAVKIIESVSSSTNFGSVPVCLLFLLFATIFLRIRFHFVVLYLAVITVAITTRVTLAALVQTNDKTDYDILAGAYSIVTLIFAVWLTYIQELTARTEFVDLFIMRQERLKSEHLLSNMLPTPDHASKLLKGDFILDELHDVTLLYSDIKGFTPLSSTMHPIQLCELLNEIYSSFDKHLNEFGMYKVDIIGDAFVVIGGLPGYKDHSQHALNAVLFAFHMLEDIRNIKHKYGVDLEIRIGIHSGGCTGSVISVNKPRYLIWGPNSILANHLEATGIPGLVHISETTLRKLGSQSLHEFGIEIIERGEIDKNKNLLNNESTYLLSCKDFAEINIVLSGKSEQLSFRTHQSRFGAALAQIPFRKMVGNRIRNLTVDTVLPLSGTNSGRVHVEYDARRERAASDPHGVRPRRAPDSPHASMLQAAITSSYFGGHTGRRSIESVSTDSHVDSEHNSTNANVIISTTTPTTRKRLDSNDSVTSNNSHLSSPRGVTSTRIQPFEEIHVNFGTSAYSYREVSYQLPKGWADVNKRYD